MGRRLIGSLLERRSVVRQCIHSFLTKVPRRVLFHLHELHLDVLILSFDCIDLIREPSHLSAMHLAPAFMDSYLRYQK